jgi:hypothetical protein
MFGLGFYLQGLYRLCTEPGQQSMKSKLGLCCLAGLLTLALFPSSSQAQGRRGGMVQSPFGPLYDTRSPEWRMAGGDMMLYQQIMEQKMMLRQQQMFMKQQQLLMKQQKSGRTGTQPGASLNAAQAAGFGNNQQPGVASTYRRRSRLRGTTATGTLKSAGKRDPAKTSAAVKKPGTTSAVTSKGTASPTSVAQTPEP